jgi:hypothetical protein
MTNYQDVIASIDLASTMENLSDESSILDVIVVTLTLIKDLSSPIEAHHAVDHDHDDEEKIN